MIRVCTRRDQCRRLLIAMKLWLESPVLTTTEFCQNEVRNTLLSGRHLQRPTIMHISAQIYYQDIEGGFWGIISDNGSKYVPIDDIPSEFQTDGIHVSADVEIVEMLGTLMWGQYVKIISISLQEPS